MKKYHFIIILVAFIFSIVINIFQYKQHCSLEKVANDLNNKNKSLKKDLDILSIFLYNTNFRYSDYYRMIPDTCNNTYFSPKSKRERSFIYLNDLQLEFNTDGSLLKITSIPLYSSITNDNNIDEN